MNEDTSTETRTNNTHRRGFASMSKEQRSAIAHLGGVAAHRYGTAHTWTPETAKIAGSLGGKKSRRGATKQKAS